MHYSWMRKMKLLFYIDNDLLYRGARQICMLLTLTYVIHLVLTYNLWYLYSVEVNDQVVQYLLINVHYWIWLDCRHVIIGLSPWNKSNSFFIMCEVILLLSYITLLVWIDRLHMSVLNRHPCDLSLIVLKCK